MMCSRLGTDRPGPAEPGPCPSQCQCHGPAPARRRRGVGILYYLHGVMTGASRAVTDMCTVAAVIRVTVTAVAPAACESRQSESHQAGRAGPPRPAGRTAAAVTPVTVPACESRQSESPAPGRPGRRGSSAATPVTSGGRGGDSESGSDLRPPPARAGGRGGAARRQVPGHARWPCAVAVVAVPPSCVAGLRGLTVSEPGRRSRHDPPRPARARPGRCEAV
jgi:hypothetical protein